MIQITYVFLLATANAPLLLLARRAAFRVKYGLTDTKGKYPYVVAILFNSTRRLCSGTMLSSEWVLTAAHCFDEVVPTHIQYGNMTILPAESSTLSSIIENIPQPGHQYGTVTRDVGLCRVKPVQLLTYGKLSAVDFTSLVGKAVEYAGYGYTHDDSPFSNRDDDRPLQIGEGVVITCKEWSNSYGPDICVAPKCSNKYADSAGGDSGGPLLYDGKVVGVVSWGDLESPIGRYAAVSPFVTWIQDIIESHNNRRTWRILKRRRT